MSVLEVVNQVSNAINKRVKFEVLNKAKAEIQKQCLDGGKIKRFIGWEAKTGFEQAIVETYEWYEEYLK